MRMVHTRNGAWVANAVLCYGTAKHCKGLVKAMKGALLTSAPKFTMSNCTKSLHSLDALCLIRAWQIYAYTCLTESWCLFNVALSLCLYYSCCIFAGQELLHLEPSSGASAAQSLEAIEQFACMMQGMLWLWLRTGGGVWCWQQRWVMWMTQSCSENASCQSYRYRPLLQSSLILALLLIWKAWTLSRSMWISAGRAWLKGRCSLWEFRWLCLDRWGTLLLRWDTSIFCLPPRIKCLQSALSALSPAGTSCRTGGR